MKKISYCLLVLLFTFCTKNEDEIVETIPENSVPSQNLLSKVNTTDNQNQLSYNLDGNKIISTLNSDNEKTDYFYNNDLISQTIIYNQNNIKTGEVNYTYDVISSKLLKSEYIGFGPNLSKKFIIDYTHNASNITYRITEDRRGGGLNPPLSTYYFNGIIEVSNGNIIRKTTVDEYNTNELSEITLEFDDKNNKTKNIVGLDKIYLNFNGAINNDYHKNNAITINNKYTVRNTILGITNVSNHFYSYLFLYNQDNFPTQVSVYYDTVLDPSLNRKFIYI